jgi:hypothetical protein
LKQREQNQDKGWYRGGVEWFSKGKPQGERFYVVVSTTRLSILCKEYSDLPKGSHRGEESYHCGGTTTESRKYRIKARGVERFLQCQTRNTR